MKYPKDLTGMTFGKISVLGRAPGYEHENKMWLCKCECGRKECKETFVMRRGNLTRTVPWTLTCGAGSQGGKLSADSKLKNGSVQKNSRTGIPGVNHSFKYPGKYRARMCMPDGKRKNRDNLDFETAVTTRKIWENEEKERRGLL